MAKRKPKRLISDTSLFLKDIKPITENQMIFSDNYLSGKSQVLLGYPGTGKTFIALHKAFEELDNPNNNHQKIVIVRSAVSTRDQGFLPGTAAEKAEVYEFPYKIICSELFGRDDAYEILKKHQIVQFITTSFVRGLTINNAIIIADEVQNMTAHEADSVLTRVGNFSKILFCGDILQRDISKRSEKTIEFMLNVLQHMPEDFDFTYFNENDIVRNSLITNYIKTKYKLYPDGYTP